MEIILQEWEFMGYTPPECDMIALIEHAGRTCYKSEDKITDDSAAKFCKMIINSGHHSVLEHVNITVKIITDRGVTHEIVRHRIASYSQESTRYCNYGENKLGIKFVLPVDFDLDEEDKFMLKRMEDHYNSCIQKGRTPQQARYFLPNGLKTEIVMTMNIREWRYFFTLRTSERAHPQMRALASGMLHIFKEKWPSLFGDIGKREMQWPGAQ